MPTHILYKYIYMYICAMNDWLTSRLGGCLLPRELWFTERRRGYTKTCHLYVVMIKGV